ncbi:hypothetical protein [Streptomyces cinerochromogenes]|uniref:hypothetical protein n=1 Tax=Streptomyces cinerochromogenes TaxID=66422 RepID=UPI0016703E79|nr:hypothetical protein [Streptomyces cinerochromogenes]
MAAHLPGQEGVVRQVGYHHAVSEGGQLVDEYAHRLRVLADGTDLLAGGPRQRCVPIASIDKVGSAVDDLYAAAGALGADTGKALDAALGA